MFLVPVRISGERVAAQKEYPHGLRNAGFVGESGEAGQCVGGDRCWVISEQVARKIPVPYTGKCVISLL